MRACAGRRGAGRFVRACAGLPAGCRYGRHVPDRATCNIHACVCIGAWRPWSALWALVCVLGLGLRSGPWSALWALVCVLGLGLRCGPWSSGRHGALRRCGRWGRGGPAWRRRRCCRWALPPPSGRRRRAWAPARRSPPLCWPERRTRGARRTLRLTGRRGSRFPPPRRLAAPRLLPPPLRHAAGRAAPAGPGCAGGLSCSLSTAGLFGRGVGDEGRAGVAAAVGPAVSSSAACPDTQPRGCRQPGSGEMAGSSAGTAVPRGGGASS